MIKVFFYLEAKIVLGTTYNYGFFCLKVKKSHTRDNRTTKTIDWVAAIQ